MATSDNPRSPTSQFWRHAAPARLASTVVAVPLLLFGAGIATAHANPPSPAPPPSPGGTSDPLGLDATDLNIDTSGPHGIPGLPGGISAYPPSFQVPGVQTPGLAPGERGIPVPGIYIPGIPVPVIPLPDQGP